MSTNADFAAWGEPPATPEEEALACYLDAALERYEQGEPADPLSPNLTEKDRRLFFGLQRLFHAAADYWQHASRFEDKQLPLPSAEPLPDPFPGEYRVRALLGQGSFGRVWLADDLNLGIPVALKTLRFNGPVADAALALDALRQEARTLAAIAHPNIVRVHAWRQAGEEHYVVLQYVAGGSLGDRVKRDGPLGWQHAARYVADVGEALLHLHARGLVHRDVKPANVLWDLRRDEALLTDFGLAALGGRQPFGAGSPPFMAPEAFEGQAIPAGDTYSLAATLFALVAGEPPFAGATKAALLANVWAGLPDPDPRCVALPESLERVVRAGLSARPEVRPPLSEFVTVLRGALNQLLADTLLLSAPTVPNIPATVHMTVHRWDGGDRFVPVAATHPAPTGRLRDLKKVPRQPDRVQLRTGDRVRIMVAADRDGYLTVFNVGPTGNLNLLHPEGNSSAAPVRAGQALEVVDVERTPPAGAERVFAVWSRVPLPLSLDRLLGLAEGKAEATSRPYRATRDLKRVQQSVGLLRPEDWHAAVLELDHRAG
jgi:serine/threonine protein kinase